MQRPPSRLLVGVGNILRGDDGIGVHVAHAVASRRLPADVEVYDAGCMGLEAAVYLKDRRLVVVVDSIDAGAEPGEIFRLSPEQLRPYLQTGVSLHDFHLLDAIEETRMLGRAPGRVVVFAVQIADVSPGMRLSGAVAPKLESVVRLTLRELGISLTDQTTDDLASQTCSFGAGGAEVLPWE